MILFIGYGQTIYYLTWAAVRTHCLSIHCFKKCLKCVYMNIFQNYVQLIPVNKLAFTSGEFNVILTLVDMLPHHSLKNVKKKIIATIPVVAILFK